MDTVVQTTASVDLSEKMSEDGLAVHQLLRPDTDGRNHREPAVVELLGLHLHLPCLVLGHEAKRVEPEVSRLVVLLEVGDTLLDGLLDPSDWLDCACRNKTKNKTQVYNKLTNIKTVGVGLWVPKQTQEEIKIQNTKNKTTLKSRSCMTDDGGSVIRPLIILLFSRNKHIITDSTVTLQATPVSASLIFQIHYNG